ncbi:MAG TPA: tetratricopeptide repeat protein [Thermoanaerobaculia bacterium]|nr:tetratricopeptide repeat protein [Thermoanaerobaculia bacterium]
MTEHHVPEDLFERFLRLVTSQEDARQIVRHLLTGCPHCSEMAIRLTTEAGLFASRRTQGKAGWEQAYEEIFARTAAFASEEEQRLALDRLRGWAHWAELEPLPPEVRFARVKGEARFHTFGLYERLLEASRGYHRREPAEAVDVVRLAILVAEQLAPSLGGERTADLRAAAWGALGNAWRIAEDFEESRRAFNEAWRILEEEGSGEPVDRAALISLEASYMKDIGELEVAETALEEALEIYRKAGEAHQKGRVLLKMGEIIGHVLPEQGISHIQKALALIDGAREPRLELCAQHALAQFLSDSGRPEEGLAVLDRARPLYRQFKDELTQLRLHWVEGKIAFRLGELAEAEQIFTQLWDELRALDLRQEVVLVTIDLAQVLVQRDETARAAQLAAECYSIMQSWGLHRDALAAWLVFQEALSYETLRNDLFTRLGEHFRRHWYQPGELVVDGE